MLPEMGILTRSVVTGRMWTFPFQFRGVCPRTHVLRECRSAREAHITLRAGEGPREGVLRSDMGLDCALLLRTVITERTRETPRIVGIIRIRLGDDVAFRGQIHRNSGRTGESAAGGRRCTTGPNDFPDPSLGRAVHCPRVLTSDVTIQVPSVDGGVVTGRTLVHGQRDLFLGCGSFCRDHGSCILGFLRCTAAGGWSNSRRGTRDSRSSDCSSDILPDGRQAAASWSQDSLWRSCPGDKHPLTRFPAIRC